MWKLFFFSFSSLDEINGLLNYNGSRRFTFEYKLDIVRQIRGKIFVIRHFRARSLRCAQLVLASGDLIVQQFDQPHTDLCKFIASYYIIDELALHLHLYLVDGEENNRTKKKYLF